MNRLELHHYCWRNVRSLDQVLVSKAVAMLARELGPETLQDIRERITEDRVEWLGGRKSVPCTLCFETGTYRMLKKPLSDSLNKLSTKDWYDQYRELTQDMANVESEEPCPQCEGTGRAHEWPLHHGFGTAVRNLLRKHGFGEQAFGIDNLDDYYSVLLEMACGFWAPVEG